MLNDAEQVVKGDLQFITANLESEFTSMAGKKILIIGGAGFLGFYLVKAIVFWNQVKPDKAISVTVFDNFSRGYPDWLSELEGTGDLTCRKVDITEITDAEIESFNFVVYGASIASPTFYRKFPIETMDANVNGLRSLLEFAKKQRSSLCPVEGFLYFSSSEIYGDPLPEFIPTDERYLGNVSCTGPRACYDESKRYGETLCVNFARQYSLPIKIARPFNNYGPGLKITDKRVIPDFARNIFAGDDIVLFSDGSPTRTFCYIADAIVGYFKILISGAPGESYNIGTESPEISVYDLALRMQETAASHFGYSGNVVRKQSGDSAYLTDNPNRRCPVIEKAREHLGFDPSISLEEGLYRSLVWYGENRVAEES